MDSMLYCKCKSHYHYKFYIIRHFIIQYHFYGFFNKYSPFWFGFGKTGAKILPLYIWLCRKAVSKKALKALGFFLDPFIKLHLCSFHKNTEIYIWCSVLTYLLGSLGKQLPTKSLWEKTIPRIRDIWVTGGKNFESNKFCNC